MSKEVERGPSFLHRISRMSHEQKAMGFVLGGLMGSLISAGISPQVALAVLLGGVGGMGYQLYKSYREPKPKPR